MSTSGIHTLHLHPPSEAVVLYQDERELYNFFLNYAQASLSGNNAVIYMAGIRTKTEVEEAFASTMDIDVYRKSNRFRIVTYDDIMLSDGKIDLDSANQKLKQLISSITRNCTITFLSESNWWILSDVFRSALAMEENHHTLPVNTNVFCTYNLDDLLNYVRIYHIARLLELHRHSMMILRQQLAIARDPKNLFRRMILDSIAEFGFSLKYNPSTNLQTVSMTGLIDRIADRNDRMELETIVESKIKWILNG